MPVQLIQPGEQTLLMDANATAAPVNSDTFAMPTTYGKTLSWTTSFASAPGAVSALLQVSNDPDGPWVDLDSSTATAGETKTSLATSAGFVRVRKASQTGGGALTVNVILSY